MKRQCSYCGKEVNGDSQDHHAIPKFIYDYFNVSGNSHMFRVVLCNEHHENFTKEWERIRFIIRKRLKNGC